MIKLYSNQEDFLWDCLQSSKTCMRIQRKKIYKHYSFTPLAVMFFLALLIFIFIQNIFTYFFVPFFCFSCLGLLILNYYNIKAFREFKLEIKYNQLFLNEDVVKEVSFFCVCDPDSYGIGPINSYKHISTPKSHCPTTGFQFICNDSKYNATQSFSLNRNYEMWDLFDFLVNNKIKFKYKYKLIEPHFIFVPRQFKMFEVEFGLDKFEAEETAVEGSYRFITKEGKRTYVIGSIVPKE